MKKQRFLNICMVTILFLQLWSCSSKFPNESQKTVFRYNESAGITSLDPAFARNQANIWAVNQLFCGLVQLDDSLRVKPSIAQRWEISKDGLAYKFHLRRDVLFHPSEVFPDGNSRPVIASDFVYSFSRITDSTLASPGAWVFSDVARKGPHYAFEAPNDSTFIITLKTPFPPFLSLLSMQYCSVVPREAVLKYGNDFRRHPVGAGPFILKLWKEGVKLVLVRNEHYFERENGHPLPYLDAIAISFIIDKQAAFLEFVKGNLDFMSGIDASYKDEMLTADGKLNPRYAKGINLLTGQYLNTEYLGIQVDPTLALVQQSPLKMKKIRQAMNYGFDRRRMMHYLRNKIGVPGIGGIIPLGLSGADTSGKTGYDYDPAKASALLTEAGFPNGKGLPPITLTTNASYLDLCKYMQSQLNEIGFDIRIDVTPPATLREMMAQAKVNFFRGSWIADYPDAENYLSLFYSGNFCPNGPNYTHFSNREFDRLYEKARQETNDVLRFEYYRQMDELLMEESPVIVLYYDQVLRFTRQSIHGLGCNPMNLLNLAHVKKDLDSPK
jgi:oligopeptide transport system substrate-binding protein